MIQKPYKRICRPMKSNNFFMDYIKDKRYANDRYMLCRSYNILEEDFKKIFNFIEPSTSNEDVYSFRIYELFIRSAMEFETNCKQILSANGYPISRSINIVDFYKINAATRLSEYKVILNIWRPEQLTIIPFDDWNNGPEYHSLAWYQDYNAVKHDRQNNFDKASLKNLIYSIAGLYCLLFSQFHVQVFNQFQNTQMCHDDNEGAAGGIGAIWGSDSLFQIVPPNWLDHEKYDFEWSTLKSTDAPFDEFRF